MSEKSVPLWLSVSKKIEEDIDNNKYGVNLPKEIEMCDIYNCSRITVRGAMSRLVDLGRVKRIRGKGSIVTDIKINEPLMKIGGFTEEMREKGIYPSTSYAHIERRNVSGYIAELFNNNKSTLFLALERVRCINDMPIGYFVTYLPDYMELSMKDEDYFTSLYERLEKEFGITVDHVKQTISAEIADKKTREMLNLIPGEAVMVMKRLAYFKGKLVEYSVCKYDGKKYEYNMELNGCNLEEINEK